MSRTHSSSQHAARLGPPVYDRDLERLLLGPGPTNAHPKVRQATGAPLVGHLDPTFSEILDEVQTGLRVLMGTENRITFAVSGTGTAGMEFLAVNFVEPGDRVLVGLNGVFGGRIGQACTKLGAEVAFAERPWGEALTVADLQKARDAAGADPDIVWVVLAETSTGVYQPQIAEMAEWAHQHNALLFVDAVTALGGVPVTVDRWGVDALFAGSQKCLGVTPGLAPVTVGPKALAKLERRAAPVTSWYLDLEKLLGYWRTEDGGRQYHHTAPIAPLYGLHESLRLLLSEGIDRVFERYTAAARALTDGLTRRGFHYQVADPAVRLPMLHCVAPPDGTDEAHLRRRLLEEYGTEVGGGLGAFKGTALRIGLMGGNARPETVKQFLKQVDEVLA